MGLNFGQKSKVRDDEAKRANEISQARYEQICYQVVKRVRANAREELDEFQ